MKKYIKNITSIFIAFILLSGGNFVYAIAHNDCIIDSNGHISCEMECCIEIPCDDEGNNGKVQIKDNFNSCCEVHVEKSMEQDVTLGVLVKKIQISKSFLINLNFITIINESTGFVPVIHKFLTSNIFLTTSNLRI